MAQIQRLQQQERLITAFNSANPSVVSFRKMSVSEVLRRKFFQYRPAGELEARQSPKRTAGVDCAERVAALVVAEMRESICCDEQPVSGTRQC